MPYKIITSGINDLATTHPEIARQAIVGDPSKVSYGSRERFTWGCELGHQWSALVSQRTSKDHQRTYNCPYCSNRRVLPGFNDLATKFPEIAREAYGWNPSTVFPSSDKKLDWICEKGHVWSMSPKHRSHQRCGCHYCSGRQILVGFNDIATTYPKLAKEAHNWDPKTLTFGSGKKVLWKCEKGHVWTAPPNRRTASDEHCPSCAEHGFSISKSGWLYLIYHPQKELIKVGISNSPDSRFRMHRSNGWLFLDIIGPMDGDQVKDRESSILSQLRSIGVDTSITSNAEKFDGYTETWRYSDFPVTTVEELMDLLSLILVPEL